MKDYSNYIIITIASAICLLFTSCRQEQISPMNQLAKDLFCFKEGSEWTYYDIVSQDTVRMMVTKHTASKYGGGKEPNGKNYDFAESVKLEINVKNSSQSISTNTRLVGAIGTDNMLGQLSNVATPVVNSFSVENFALKCDNNNNFTPSAVYHSNYVVNGVTYSDVYEFNININATTYYVAKHVGFIKCVASGSDLVLIDKNVLQ